MLDNIYDTSDFVLINKVISNVILDIRYYSNYNFVGEYIDGYEEPCAIATKEAVSALKQASIDLLKNCKIENF